MHLIVACGFALLGVLWLSVGWVVTERRGEAIRAEFRQNANVAGNSSGQQDAVSMTNPHYSSSPSMTWFACSR